MNVFFTDQDPDFQIGYGFSAYLDSVKKVWSGSGKNPDPKHCLFLPVWIRKRIQIGSSSAIYGTNTGLNQAHAGDVISGHYISRQVVALTDPTVRGGRCHILCDQQFSFLILLLKNFKQIFCFLSWTSFPKCSYSFKSVLLFFKRRIFFYSFPKNNEIL